MYQNLCIFEKGEFCTRFCNWPQESRNSGKHGQQSRETKESKHPRTAPSISLSNQKTRWYRNKVTGSSLLLLFSRQSTVKILISRTLFRVRRRPGRISMPLPYRALCSYIRYTLYFIAYTPPPLRPTRPLPPPRPLLARWLHAPTVVSPGADIMPWPDSRTRLSRSILPPSLLPPPRLALLALPAKRNIFPGHYFYRASSLRT